MGTYAWDGATTCYSCAVQSLTGELLSNPFFNNVSAGIFTNWTVGAGAQAYTVDTVNGRISNGTTNNNCIYMNNTAGGRWFVAQQTVCK